MPSLDQQTLYCNTASSRCRNRQINDSCTLYQRELRAGNGCLNQYVAFSEPQPPENTYNLLINASNNTTAAAQPTCVQTKLCSAQHIPPSATALHNTWQRGPTHKLWKQFCRDVRHAELGIYHLTLLHSMTIYSSKLKVNILHRHVLLPEESSCQAASEHWAYWPTHSETPATYTTTSLTDKINCHGRNQQTAAENARLLSTTYCLLPTGVCSPCRTLPLQRSLRQD